MIPTENETNTLKATHAAYLDTGLNHLEDFHKELYRYITEKKIEKIETDEKKDKKKKNKPFCYAIEALYAEKLNLRIEAAFPFLKEKYQDILAQLPELECDEYEEEKKKIKKEEQDGNREAQKLHSYTTLLIAFHYLLESYRNFYTHYIHDLVDYDLSFLYPIYQYSLDELKRRFSLEDNNQEITHLRNQEDILSTLEKKSGKKGEIFFACLFLNKREIELYLSQLTGFKRTGTKDETSSERWARHTRQVYSIPRMKLYRQRNRLKAEQHSQDLLAMSCLNEISRCPKELFSLLSPEHQQAFRISLENTTGENNDEQEEVLLKRYKDRFEQICLALLEQEESFKGIRFYVRLGHHDLKDYHKKLINRKTIHRCLRKPRAGFVKLYQYDTSTLEEKPYFVLNQNKIGLILSDKDVLPDDLKHKNPVAQFWLSKNELPALALYAWLYAQQSEKQQGTLKSIKDILKELQRNYSSLKREKKNSLDNAKKIRERLNTYIDKTEEEVKRLEDFLKRKKEENILTMKEGDIAMRLAKDIVWLQPADLRANPDGKENHKGKITGANFQALQYELARYSYSRKHLMNYYKDPQVRLVGSDNKHPFLKEINPRKNYSFITYALNYYKAKKSYIQSQQDEFKNDKTNLNFYPIRDLRDDYKKGPSQEMPIQIPRGTFNKVISENIKILIPAIQQYYTKEELERKEGEEKKLKFNELVFNVLKAASNTPKEEKEIPPYQTFYDWGRKYDYLNHNNEEPLYHEPEERKSLITERVERIKEMKKTDKRKKPQKRILQQIVKREELIRFRSVQDIILFLFAKKILVGKLNTNIEFHLNRLYAKAEEKNNLLDMSYHFMEEHIYIPGREDNKNSPGSIFISGDLKLKDYGRWMGLYNTQTVATLNNLLAVSQVKAPITIEYIENEINNFIRHKEEIVTACQEMEKAMIKQLQKDGKCPNLIKKGGYYNFNKLLEKYLTHFAPATINTDEIQTRISRIRNAFSHTEYKLIFKEILGKAQIATIIDNYNENKEGNRFISQAIIEWFKNETERLVK